jgi:hypothetical protein
MELLEALGGHAAGLAREGDETQVAGGHHGQVGQVVLPFPALPGERVDPLVGTSRGGRRHAVIARELREPRPEVARSVVLAPGLHVHGVRIAD